MKSTKTTAIFTILFIVSLSTSALSGPIPLTPLELDQITAGSPETNTSNASGGAIVASDSTATISLTGTVLLEDNAQSNAMALNLVNSSESTVANGVNIWDGRIDTDGNFSAGGHLDVDQSNNIAQEQRRVASLPEYERLEMNLVESWSKTTTLDVISTHSEVNDVTDIVSASSTDNTTTSGNVDTQSNVVGQQIKTGKGVAGSGEVDVHFDAGDVSLNVAGGIGGDAVSAELTLTIGLPELTVGIVGSGCAVMGGSCDATGSTTHSTDDMTDRSTHHTLDTTNDLLESTTEMKNRTVRAPLSLENAQAEYIVVDNSNLEVSSLFTVTLSGTAQQDLKALNVVNAAGSAVANGVNIARTRTATLMTGNGQYLNLNQSNVIVHSR